MSPIDGQRAHSWGLEDTQHPSGTDTGRIDWTRLDAPREYPSDTVLDPVSGSILDPSALLAAYEPLDPARLRADVASLHPDRLMPASDVQQAALDDAYRANPTPETLAVGINPGYYSWNPDLNLGRSENCADCARAFQESLEGTPRVAASIDSRGLPTLGSADAGGEHISYTEQWAGRRAEVMGLSEVGERVERIRGSAIVFGHSDRGGHAFNAYWDDRVSRVRMVDAQAGTIADWNHEELQRSWPRTQAIIFDRGGRTR